MRFWAPLVALFTAAVFAQQNAIVIPNSGLNIVAGSPNTITWINPSSGTVTVKLQQYTQLITPDTGIILSSSVKASDQTFTFTIPASSVNSFQYVIEIIDNSNSNNYNFSPNFGIKGATGTAIASGSATSLSSGATITMSQTASSTGSSITGSSSMSGSSSSSGTASRTSSSGMSSSSSASRTGATTSSSSAPNPNSGVSMKVHGGLLAAVAGFMAVL